MAIARLSMKVGRVGKAAPHAAYIARQGRYAKRLEKGEKLLATEAGNMPQWARHNPLFFWEASDRFERKNGTTYREMEIALPRELDAEQQVDLVHCWIDQEIGHLHAYQWAIHESTASDGGAQPHLHLMLSERRRDGIDRDPDQYFKRYNSKSPEIGGARKGYGSQAGEKLTKAARAAELKDLRSRWESMCNTHLERADVSARIDMRSHAERETGLEPERKMLPSEWRGQGRDNIIEFRKARGELADSRRELSEVIPSVTAEIISLQSHRQRREEASGEAAERIRIGQMNSRQLAEEIELLRPRPEIEVVANTPAVMAAKKHLTDCRTSKKKDIQLEKQLQGDISRWRDDHPTKASLHDMGLLPSLDLQRLNLKHTKALQKSAEKSRRLIHAERLYESAVQSSLEIVRADQASMRARLLKLEKLLAEKLREEKMAQIYRDKICQSFVALARKRELDLIDEITYWQVLPDYLKSLVDEFNRSSPDFKGKLLSAMSQDEYLCGELSKELGQNDVGNDVGFSNK